MTSERPPAAEMLDEALDVLACDYQARPRDAPSFFDLQSGIRSLRRDDASLRVAFDPAARDAVRQLVEAERLCCAEIGWELHDEPELILRITATPAQLDIFERFLSSAT